MSFVGAVCDTRLRDSLGPGTTVVIVMAAIVGGVLAGATLARSSTTPEGPDMSGLTPFRQVEIWRPPARRDP